MFKDDFPLVSAPGLMALILKQAETGDVTLNSCAHRVDALFADARKVPALPPEEIRERLDGHIRDLVIARLLEPGREGVWLLTERGRMAIHRHPDGVGPSVLNEFPEYAAHIEAAARRATGMDPHSTSYDQGYQARRQGQHFTVNPYKFDIVDHLSWENGWMQALDEEEGCEPSEAQPPQGNDA